MKDDIREQIHEEMMRGTPRYQRAVQFSNQIMGLLCDFLPHDRDCLRATEDYLLEAGFAGNAQIINVPPEWDALNKLQMERAMIETHPILVKGHPLMGDLPGGKDA